MRPQTWLASFAMIHLLSQIRFKDPTHSDDTLQSLAHEIQFNGVQGLDSLLPRFSHDGSKLRTENLPQDQPPTIPAPPEVDPIESPPQKSRQDRIEELRRKVQETSGHCDFGEEFEQPRSDAGIATVAHAEARLGLAQSDQLAKLRLEKLESEVLSAGEEEKAENPFFGTTTECAGRGPLATHMRHMGTAIEDSRNTALQMQYWKFSEELNGRGGRNLPAQRVMSDREMRRENTLRMKEQINLLKETSSRDFEFMQAKGILEKPQEGMTEREFKLASAGHLWNKSVPPMFQNCEVDGVWGLLRGDDLNRSRLCQEPNYPRSEQIQIRGGSYPHYGWYNERPEQDALLEDMAVAPNPGNMDLPNFGLLPQTKAPHYLGHQEKLLWYDADPKGRKVLEAGCQADTYQHAMEIIAESQR